jgi:nucleoid DNA-binding protein
MDIAKYIGLFLLKNNFCYLHGFGNLELKKKPASYNGDALQAPEYDVVLTPGGSIDDTLANYIATHEQTSISKAANALRDFSTATRAELAAGKEVEIPGIGKFAEQNGAVQFYANPHLKYAPPAVPALRMSKRLEEAPDFRRDSQDNHPGGAGSGINISKLAVPALVIIALIIAVILGMRYFKSSDTASVTDTTATAVVHAEQPVEQPAATPATAPAPASAMQTSGNPNEFRIVVNTYSTRAAADKRATKLTNNGNKVDVISRDSTSHLVTLYVTGSPADTTRMIDSLRRFFNPKGVYILR